MARRNFVAGNWKMNKLSGEAGELVRALVPLVKDLKNVDIAVCPPFTAIAAAAGAIKGTNVMLGAQNLYTTESDGQLINSGAYTGEVSATMLKDAGCEWVIIGHSERRQYFGETDQSVNAKIRAAWAAGLKTIVCIGETLEQRDAGVTDAVNEIQVRTALAGLDAAKVKELVLAYEPVWAIGTGRTATPQQAQDAHAAIRSVVKDMFGADVADAVRIQYGGSMKPGNAAELLSQPDIDGGLIGGAALKADDFSGICKAANG